MDWDGNELLLSDLLGSDPDIVNRGIEQESEKQTLLRAVEKLDPREKQIMELRFGLNRQKEHTQRKLPMHSAFRSRTSQGLKSAFCTD